MPGCDTLDTFPRYVNVSIPHFRDLKPENIMFQDKTLDSPIKVIDFGEIRGSDVCIRLIVDRIVSLHTAIYPFHPSAVSVTYRSRVFPEVLVINRSFVVLFNCRPRRIV